MFVLFVSDDCGVLQDCVNEVIHSPDSADQQVDLFASIVVEFVIVVIEQPLRQRAYAPQGSFEVVSGEVVEFSEMLVGAA